MNKIITISEVETLTNLSRSTIRRLESKNLFPNRVKLGLCRVGWIENEVSQWIEELKERREVKNVE
jgi:prophage regulatory protein